MYPACVSVQFELLTGLSEAPVVPSCFICSVRTEATGLTFPLGVEWGCGLAAPLPSGLMGSILYFSPCSRGLFSTNFFTMLIALDDGCLIDKAMDPPTHEGSLFKLYISSSCTRGGK